jgi:hypothetical protein
MLAGLITALVLAPAEVRKSAFSSGAKHAGVIIFDLCGAGALGAVIGAGNLGIQAFGLLTMILPALAVPFLLAALIQTAQGSRVHLSSPVDYEKAKPKYTNGLLVIDVPYKKPSIGGKQIKIE